ncbi:DUF2076 domain-containing protein [Rhizobium sp. LC145]|uniref:DUF2076 domain-containing protein n=1 Tax=Rhizobium sp. LC145 TaxID=1120688 RepID=UPI00062A269B|nr:DUF2076 domain-containing protein [Rhizobium sp. LC145]KKX32910.1 hypothetical protein YH62_04985 [Rhizobium sp. LC145]TKT57322.1 DUF2076 domain-containing protein [Rhizobiaceae bacterium LC148]
MDRNDQQAIESLFSKLALVEQQSGQRDAESDRFIQQRINQHPGAPYYMAQTIVVQEQALEAAQRRIEELEYQASQGQQRGGFFSSMFGNSTAPRSTSPQPAAYGRPAPASPWGNQQQGYGQQTAQQRSGGGFLAGAAQTAMGVAGGVLLGNAIAGMFTGDEAQAAEPDATAPNDEAPADDMDLGGDEDI